jgi:hypothetical protein
LWRLLKHTYMLSTTFKSKKEKTIKEVTKATVNQLLIVSYM